MRVLAFAQHELPPELHRQLTALQDQAWPRGAGEPVTGHDPALRPVVLLLVDDSELVLSSLAILSKEISHAGLHWSASGLSAVVTERSRRGHGHGHRLVTAARDRLAAGGVDLAIFSCDRPLAGFYARAGFRVLPGTVLIGGTPDDPFPTDRFDKVVLAELFTEQARRHAGSFSHASIELYPGTIDRLW